jgi:hypothetical protein
MKTKITTILAMMAALFVLSGCLDGQSYGRSEFARLDIADLVGITDTPYYIYGSGSLKKGGVANDSVFIRFCKNNKFTVTYGYAMDNITIEGTYTVDLDRNEINFTSDKGRKGALSVGNRYIKQRSKVVIKGYNAYIKSIVRINTAKCDDSDFN